MIGVAGQGYVEWLHQQSRCQRVGDQHQADKDDALAGHCRLHRQHAVGEPKTRAGVDAGGARRRAPARPCGYRARSGPAIDVNESGLPQIRKPANCQLRIADRSEGVGLERDGIDARKRSLAIADGDIDRARPQFGRRVGGVKAQVQRG